MKLQLYKYYKDLPGWAKGVVVVGGLSALYFGGRGLYNTIQSAIHKGKSQKSIKNVATEIKDLENAGLQASYSPSQYSGWADTIVKQFEGCDPSTPGGWKTGDLSFSGQKLQEILLKMNNDIDFLNLVKAFGIRTYDACGIWNGDVENVTLYSAVADELEVSEITFINKSLKGRGITYQF